MSTHYSKPVLVRSVQSIQAADLLPANAGRASRVHALIDALGLKDSVQIEAARAATDEELCVFHSAEYVRAVCHSESDNSDDDDGEADSDESDFGLVHGCSRFVGMASHVRYAAGGTLVAAEALIAGRTRTALHWEGGRHHGRRARAAGFCYINDAVLGILRLQQRFSRILYIDLDVHHGDGVQLAFEHSARVTTLSLHHASRGFYPGTGLACVEGRGRGQRRSINVNLQPGARDGTFTGAYSAVGELVVERFAPDAVVLQCGCDGLAGDPHKVFNLTTDAYAECLRVAMAWARPLLVLGGGGYSHSDCARCWARLTAVACGRGSDVPADVPEHEFLGEYGPGFEMAVDAMRVADENSADSVRAIVDAIAGQLG
ncbi:hypothetical protein LPJ66_006184 [Kickxella alabastrina]|uniref:Uncharacterized protein n=1 Tax=Kickxella alabastrina TaxID=61397 RepID=A0ACC1ID06_9FUNG|nr:hypothetical protein LPJ66_006184 [Kickxella alabastrina]